MDYMQVRLLAVQVVTSTPTFIIVPCCAAYAIYAWYSGLEQLLKRLLLTAGLLVASLDGSLDSYCWLIIFFLVYIAATSEEKSGEQAGATGPYRSRLRCYGSELCLATIGVIACWWAYQVYSSLDPSQWAGWLAILLAVVVFLVIVWLLLMVGVVRERKQTKSVIWHWKGDSKEGANQDVWIEFDGKQSAAIEAGCVCGESLCAFLCSF